MASKWRVMQIDALNSLASIKPGFPFRGAIDALEPGGVAAIQMRNVTIEGVRWEDVTRVALPTGRGHDFLVAGDVIFATRGAKPRAVALREVPGEAVCSTHFFIISVCDAGRIDPAFLAWQINQRPAQDYLAQAATGSHILNITRGAIEALPVAVPPLDVQRRLVAYAEAVAGEQAALQNLIELRQRELGAIATQLLTGKHL